MAVGALVAFRHLLDGRSFGVNTALLGSETFVTIAQLGCGFRQLSFDGFFGRVNFLDLSNFDRGFVFIVRFTGN